MAVAQEERRACVGDEYGGACIIHNSTDNKPKQHRLARSLGLSQIPGLGTPYSVGSWCISDRNGRYFWAWNTTTASR